MVFVLKKEENGNTYYYLAHNARVSKNKWKSYRRYIGKKVPSKENMEKLEKEFVEENGIKVGKQFKYIDKEKLDKVDYIISDFREKTKKYPKIALKKIERDFTIKFTYDTNAIEGNTVSLIEATALLNKKVAPPGKSLREVYEITNTEKAIEYLKKFKGGLSKRLVCRLHKIMMENIENETTGKFRDYNVSIQGANWFPAQGREVEKKFKELMNWHKKNKNKLHPIELAAITHLKFIEIHPFGDGNGRIARLITNHILMKNGYPPLNIKEKDTLEYVKVLQFSQNNQKFKELVNWFMQKLGENYSNMLTKA